MLERFKTRISPGMQVRSADGERLGKVVSCQGSGFVVEKGILFPRDLTVPYERITDVRDGEILLAISRADFTEANIGGIPTTAKASTSAIADEAKTAGIHAREGVAGAAADLKAAGKHATQTLDQFGKSGELCVPLVEEEIVTSKHIDKIGEIHVRKEVITEEKQITVPVMREVIRVERVAVNRDVPAGTKAFEQEAYDIPISEEHVTVEKRSVIHEEVHIGKEIQQAQENARATVRREKAEIETLGPVRRAEAQPPGNDVRELRPTGTGGRR